MNRPVLIVSMLGLLAPAAYAQQPTSGMSAQAQVGQHVVFFPFDSAELDPEALNVLAAAAEEYSRTGATRVDVRGHTDTSGSADYNQRLSEQRAEAVAQELARLGVPFGSITTIGLGETDLLVQTPDGVREPRNRRAEIYMETPPPAVTTPPPPPPVAEAPPEPEREQPRGLFSLGALYGYNMQDGDDEDKSSHLAGLNLSFDYGLARWVALSLEQAGFYNFFADDEGFGGRTAAGLNFTFGMTDVVPYVGANIGYIYGSGIEDDFFAGPEIGVNLWIFNGKVAYDIPFDRDIEDGIIVGTLGLGIRF